MADRPDALTEVSPGEFFAAVRSAYDRARALRPPWTGLYRFGPSRVRLEIASPTLASFMPSALVPPEPAGEETGASTILAWDEVSTGVPCPPPPWGGVYCYTRRGDIPGFEDPRYWTSYNYEANLLTMFDRQERVGLYWTRDAARLPGWERTAPLRTLWHWHGLENGLQLTHGAVVGTDGRGMLLVGKGGSGKSTTALLALEAGLTYLSDDYCFTDGERAYALYANARMLPDSLGWLPELAALRGVASDEKLAVDVARAFPQRWARELPLSAIVLPEVRPDGELAIQDADRASCLKALALTTIAQLPGAGPASYALLQRLAERLPAYRLVLSGPPAGAVSKLRELLSLSAGGR